MLADLGYFEYVIGTRNGLRLLNIFVVVFSGYNNFFLMTLFNRKFAGLC